MLALPFHPLTTILMLTTGMAFISFECNRPGLILPGASGLLLVLLGLASILKTSSAPEPLVAFAFAGLFFWLDQRNPQKLRAVPVGILTLLGFLALPGVLTHPVSSSVSLLCAAIITVGSHYFNRIAKRARVNKGLD